MNIKNENDFVVNVKTPTSSISQHVSLGDQKSRSVSYHSKSPNVHRSSNSVSYSDSFDNDSPIKVPITKKVKCIDKVKCHKTASFYRKSKVSVRTTAIVVKPNATTKTLLETNKMKINELLSENSDYHRQLLEKSKELKTLQNQNKIQESYLKKVNNRDADVPNMISRYNSEIHSLQELLRRNKEKLELSNKQKKDIESDLNKVKAKNERLASLCDNKELQEKDDLIKKIRSLNEILETETKKQNEMERNVELMTKKHTHRMNMEFTKYRELNQNYKDMVNELKDTRNLLKEKTKLLEMQNICSKMVLKPPHHLFNSTSEMGDCDEHRNSDVKGEHVSLVKTARQKEDKEHVNRSNQNITTLTKPSYLKKSIPLTKNLPDADFKAKKLMMPKSKTKVSFSREALPEVQEVKEKYEKRDRFSEFHETVRKNMQDCLIHENDKAFKNDILSRLKQIDETRTMISDGPNEASKKKNINDDNYECDKDDNFSSLESGDESSEPKSSDTSSCLFLPKVSTNVIGSRKQISDDQRKSQQANFDFLGYSLNNNNCYGGARTGRYRSRLVNNDDEFSER